MKWTSFPCPSTSRHLFIASPLIMRQFVGCTLSLEFSKDRHGTEREGERFFFLISFDFFAFEFALNMAAFWRRLDSWSIFRNWLTIVSLFSLLVLPRRPKYALSLHFSKLEIILTYGRLNLPKMEKKHEFLKMYLLDIKRSNTNAIYPPRRQLAICILGD